MIQKLISTTVVAAALLLAGPLPASAAAPVAKVAAYAGGLEYSKNGGDWHAITRPNKYLLSGYALRTGASGSAEILIQASGETQLMGANSTVRIGDSSIELVSGDLSQPEELAGSYVQSLYNKFLTSQRYTTVRRSSNGDPTKFKTVRALTASTSYPDVVWENVGPTYSYRVQVNGATHDVPSAPGAEMIRFTLPALSPGKHTLKVAVVENGEVVHTSRPTKLTWLGADENARYLGEEQAIRSGVYADGIVLAAFQAENGLKVAALDTYREFFSSNPDENEVRPMLAQAYAELHMGGLQSKEASMYQELAWGGL